MLRYTSSTRKMIAVLFVPLFVLCCVNMAAGDVDMAFCAKQITDSTVGAWSPPKFKDNFMVVVERKLNYNFNKSNEMSNTEMYFSHQKDAARLVLDTVDDIFDVYALGRRNTLFKLTRNELYPACIGVPLRTSPLGQFFVAVQNNTQTALGYPSEVVQFSRGLQYYNLTQTGSVLMDRGITVDVVRACQYHAATDGTSVATYYFNNPSKTKMPGEPDIPVIVRVEVIGVSHQFDPSKTPYNYSITYDYTHFDYGKPVKQSIFQVDSNMYCQFPNNSNPKPLPQVKGPFRYRLDLLTRTDYGTYNETQQLVRYVMTLNPMEKTFIQETVGPSSGYDNLIQTEHDIMVNDFNVGMQFTVDRIRGSCVTSPIDVYNEDVVTIPNTKFVTLATVKQLLDMDGNYQYMGTKMIRSIQCDVWRAAFGGDADAGRHYSNSIYTWYFATDAWKNIFRSDMSGYTLPVQMDIEMPVRTDVMSGERISGSGVFLTYNLYEFSNLFLYKPIPEVSNCFTPDTISNIQFLTRGNYDIYVKRNVPGFRLAVIKALMTNGKFVSPNRISRVDFMPFARRHIIILVTLLDYSGLKGDVQAPESEPSNAIVIQNLKQAIDSQNFRIDISQNVNGQSIQIQRFAVPMSLKSFDPLEERPYNPNNGDDNGNGGGQTSSDSDSGYGGGDMAGLAIGMIVTTLVVTLVCVYLFLRYRGVGDGQAVAMSKLTPDP